MQNGSMTHSSSAVTVRLPVRSKKNRRNVAISDIPVSVRVGMGRHLSPFPRSHCDQHRLSWSNGAGESQLTVDGAQVRSVIVRYARVQSADLTMPPERSMYLLPSSGIASPMLKDASTDAAVMKRVSSANATPGHTLA